MAPCCCKHCAHLSHADVDWSCVQNISGSSHTGKVSRPCACAHGPASFVSRGKSSRRIRMCKSACNCTSLEGSLLRSGCLDLKGERKVIHTCISACICRSFDESVLRPGCLDLKGECKVIHTCKSACNCRSFEGSLLRPGCLHLKGKRKVIHWC